MRRRLWVVFAALALTFAALLGTSLLAIGQASSTDAKIHVSPAKGSPHTRFAVGFNTPDTTGHVGTVFKRDVVSVNTSHPRKGCIGSAAVDAPTAQAGDRVRVKLSPAQLGGKWCLGSYHGTVQELQSHTCPPGSLCPLFVLMQRKLGSFTLRIKH